MMRTAGIAGVIAVALAGSAVTLSGQELKIKKGDQRVLVVPRVLMKKDVVIYNPPTGSDLIVNERPDWRDAGLPAMLPVTVFEVSNAGTKQRPAYVITVHSQDGPLIFLRTRVGMSNPQGAIDQIATDSATAERLLSEAAVKMKTRLMSLPLSLSDEVAGLIVKAAVDSDWNAVGGEAFKDANYLVIDRGSSRNIYNDLQVRDSVARATHLVNDQLAADLKLVTPLMAKLPGTVMGIKLQYAVGHKDARLSGIDAEYEPIALYISLAALRKFANLDLSLQQLIKEAVVVANGSRVDIGG